MDGASQVYTEMMKTGLILDTVILRDGFCSAAGVFEVVGMNGKNKESCHCQL